MVKVMDFFKNLIILYTSISTVEMQSGVEILGSEATALERYLKMYIIILSLT